MGVGVGVDGGGGARGASQLTDRRLPAAYSLTVSLCVPMLLTSRCEGDCVHLKLQGTEDGQEMDSSCVHLC